MKRFFAAALVAASFFGAAQLFASTNVIANPGFESGALSPWFNARNFCGSPCQNWAIDSTNPHSGTFDAMDIGNIEIRQDFAGVAVSSITQVSFWMEHPDGAGTPMAFDLFYTDGTDNEFLVTSTDASYDFFDVTFALTPGLTLDGISFFGVSGAGSDITFLDDVSVLTNAPAIPEPSSLLMLGSGLMLGAGFIRRKFAR